MHRCLFVPELVLLIMESLWNGEGFSIESARALAVLARTSKWLSDPALNILWREQTGLQNIIPCMPECAFSKDGHGVKHLNGNIGQNDWERFHLYASRIRVLRLEEPHDIRNSAAFMRTLHVLSKLKLQAEPFPALQSLTWRSRSYRGAAYIPTLTGKSLTYLDIRHDTPHAYSVAQLTRSLSLLPSRSPALRELRLAISHRFDFDTAALHSILSQLNELRSISLLAGQVSSDAMLHLVASLPRLEVLKLASSATYNGPHAPAYVYTPISNFQYFPSLKAMTLANDGFSQHLNHYTRLIRTFAPQMLEDLILDDCRIPDSATLPGLLNTMSATLCGETLKCFSLFCQPHAPLTLGAIDIHTLRPLLSFHNLVDVYLDLNEKFCLNDASIELFATSWPKLEYLCLSGAFLNDEDTVPTLEAFGALTRHCPNLLDVTFDFEATLSKTNHVSASTLQGHTPNLKIYTLDVQGSRMADMAPRDVAQYLLQLFPNLILTTCDDDSDYSEAWTMVQDNVKLLSGAEALTDGDGFKDLSKHFSQILY